MENISMKESGYTFVYFPNQTSFETEVLPSTQLFFSVHRSELVSIFSVCTFGIICKCLFFGKG